VVHLETANQQRRRHLPKRQQPRADSNARHVALVPPEREYQGAALSKPPSLVGDCTSPLLGLLHFSKTDRMLSW
jgi:hypothetical protein